jgi:hypothetical protein
MGGGNGGPGGPLPFPFPLPGPPPKPGGRAFLPADWQRLKDGIKPITSPGAERLDGLQSPYASAPAPQDNIAGFADAHTKIHAGPADIAPAHADEWGLGSSTLGKSGGKFSNYFAGQQGTHGWQGKTGDAIRKNAMASAAVVEALAAAADRMGIIVGMFSGAIASARNYFNGPNWDAYQKTVIDGPPDDPYDLKDRFDAMAASFLTTVYRPVIDKIADNHPNLDGVMPPTLGTPAPGPGAPGRGGGGELAPGKISPGGLGAPEVPDDAVPAPAGPAPGGGPPGGPSPGGGNAGQGPGDAAQKAAQNAATPAANSNQQGPGQGDAANGARPGAGRLPEGVLGLGPKGLGNAAKGGAGARGAGGGGAGARTPLTKPVEARMTSPSKPTAAAPVSRAGVGSSGGPGTGAPAAGHRGAAGDKVHKASKALYQQKHGEEVVGETEAVVPVVGGDPDAAPPARPDSA